MLSLSWDKAGKLFHTLCVFATIGLQIQCIYKYSLDEDVSLVSYRRFHAEKDNIYPSLSFCIINPFLEDRLKAHGKGINITSYSYYLQGLLWDERMLKIDYDNVTMSLFNNFVAVVVNLQNRTRIRGPHLHGFSSFISHPGWKPHFHVSFRSAATKCFTVDIPFVQNEPLLALDIELQNSIFSKGVRPEFEVFDGLNPDTGGGFATYLHYPGQRFLSDSTMKHNWKPRANKLQQYAMNFRVKDIEVLEHRNKGKTPCTTDWKNYDQIVMDAIMKNVGCRPPHWTTAKMKNLQLCSNVDDMKNFMRPTSVLQNFIPPCQFIERIHYDYTEDDFATFANTFAMRVIHQPTDFRKIKQTKAYDLESLVGNVGGYMGLFLGYALLQLPALCMILWSFVKKALCTMTHHKCCCFNESEEGQIVSGRIVLGNSNDGQPNNELPPNKMPGDGGVIRKIEEGIKANEKRIKRMEEKLEQNCICKQEPGC